MITDGLAFSSQSDREQRWDPLTLPDGQARFQL
jgi:hypothetical protein